jgi:hypothetical protein
MGRQRRIRHARKVIRHDLDENRLSVEDALSAYEQVKETKAWYCPNCHREGTADHQCRGVVTIDMGGKDE